MVSAALRGMSSAHMRGDVRKYQRDGLKEDGVTSDGRAMSRVHWHRCRRASAALSLRPRSRRGS
jgi:hypothetical protein